MSTKPLEEFLYFSLIGAPTVPAVTPADLQSGTEFKFVQSMPQIRGMHRRTAKEETTIYERGYIPRANLSLKFELGKSDAPEKKSEAPQAPRQFHTQTVSRHGIPSKLFKTQPKTSAMKWFTTLIATIIAFLQKLLPFTSNSTKSTKLPEPSMSSPSSTLNHPSFLNLSAVGKIQQQQQPQPQLQRTPQPQLQPQPGLRQRTPNAADTSFDNSFNRSFGNTSFNNSFSSKSKPQAQAGSVRFAVESPQEPPKQQKNQPTQQQNKLGFEPEDDSSNSYFGGGFDPQSGTGFDDYQSSGSLETVGSSFVIKE